MSIQLQGNAESTFTNDVTIGGDKITLSGSDGSASFAGERDKFFNDGSFEIYRSNGASNGTLGAFYSDVGSTRDQVITFKNNGSAIFKGGTSQRNVTLELDTGGTIDVKERLQNTQAILYRLKAALIQPDADVNTLRQRLLEALDILTSDGDES